MPRQTKAAPSSKRKRQVPAQAKKRTVRKPTARAKKPTTARPAPTTAALAEMRAILRAGLPVTSESAGSLFPRMASVRARAARPDSRQALVVALDRVLRGVLTDLGDGPRGRAARVLFAMEAPPGRDERFLHEWRFLTVRRELAAGLMGCKPETFRGHHEKRILDDVILELARRDEEYKARVPGSPASLDIKGHAPDLTSAELTEREELISLIWSSVYGLRAELIGAMRSADESTKGSDYVAHAGRALWQMARLLEFKARFLDRFGETLLHGSVPYSAEGTIWLAGWRGDLAEDQVQYVRYILARVSPDEANAFVRALERTRAGRGVLIRWVELLDEWAAVKIEETPL